MAGVIVEGIAVYGVWRFLGSKEEDGPGIGRREGCICWEMSMLSARSRALETHDGEAFRGMLGAQYLWES